MRSSRRRAVEEVDERVDGEPEHDEQRHDGGELEPAAREPRGCAPDATTGNSPGSRLTRPTNTERKAMASSMPAKATQIGRASLSWWIMRALLRAAIAGRPVTEMRDSRDTACADRSSARSIFSTTGRIWLEVDVRAGGRSPARRSAPWR